MDYLVGEHQEAWVDTYRGHLIATQREQRSWRAVLDQVVQVDQDFESAEEAAAWLRRRVDSRIAETIFPGLAFV